MRSGHRQVHDFGPARQHEQRAVVAERHVHLDEDRHRERDGLAARARTRSRTPRAGRGSARGSRESIVSTFQLSGRRPASVISAIMLDLVVGEAAQAAVGDVLERRAFVLAHRAAQREHFVVRRPARRDRLAVAVGVRERERGREAEAARRDRLVQQRAPSRRAARASPRCRSLSAPITLRRSAQWPTRKPTLSADVAVERAEVVGERPPAPRHAGLERGERHAFDLRHHAAQVVGVVGRRAARA